MKTFNRRKYSPLDVFTIFGIRYLSMIFLGAIVVNLIIDFFHIPNPDLGTIILNVFAISLFILTEVLVWIGIPLLVRGYDDENI
jgi:hypothetical protein|nr:MAG TPA: hypothetical protein [Caudoviricetes sp.]